ncbi:hypothetical protein COO60DRAFT_1633589 [Scenedesmus sp. NREL 46B-D3]|nr:hypothetical protein COO60DRAFT_1633589 [Scenedesmus sp. NREL 46B-D3]
MLSNRWLEALARSDVLKDSANIPKLNDEQAQMLGVKLDEQAPQAWAETFATVSEEDQAGMLRDLLKCDGLNLSQGAYCTFERGLRALAKALTKDSVAAVEGQLQQGNVTFFMKPGAGLETQQQEQQHEQQHEQWWRQRR